MNPALEEQAVKLTKMAEELELAAAHAKTAARHFQSGEVPRGCAHAFTSGGHMTVASEILADVAKQHRLKATP